MNRIVGAGLTALVLSLGVGCQPSDPLPDAPPPVRDAYSDPDGSAAPKAAVSKGDASRKYKVEGGASAEER